jgi:hypothetical protein
LRSLHQAQRIGDICVRTVRSGLVLRDQGLGADGRDSRMRAVRPNTVRIAANRPQPWSLKIVAPQWDDGCRGRSECPALCRHKNTDQEARARRGLRLAHGASCTAVHTGPVDCTRGSAHHGPYWAGDKDAGTCSCSGSAHPLLCCGACGSGEGDEEGQSDFVHEGSRRTRGAEVAEGLRAIFCHSHQRQPSATLPLHRPYGSSRRGGGTGRR